MIPKSFAGNALLALFGLLFIFHWLVLFGLVPHDIVWAGKISNQTELIQMESVSLLIVCLFSIVVALKMGYLKFPIKPVIVNAGVWLIAAFFALNTLGNATAINPVEKYGFGLLTLVLTFLAVFLAISKK